jgi:hypothetical protein
MRLEKNSLCVLCKQMYLPVKFHVPVSLQWFIIIRNSKLKQTFVLLQSCYLSLDTYSILTNVPHFCTIRSLTEIQYRQVSTARTSSPRESSSLFPLSVGH